MAEILRRERSAETPDIDDACKAISSAMLSLKRNIADGAAIGPAKA
ncbi:hypothetical protein [Chachezhania sediminis]|nr:hypothetical protein [Chachezhania sediminis]